MKIKWEDVRNSNVDFPQVRELLDNRRKEQIKHDLKLYEKCMKDIEDYSRKINGGKW